MHTAAYKVDVASDRRRRENVPRHILCSNNTFQETQYTFLKLRKGFPMYTRKKIILSFAGMFFLLLLMMLASLFSAVFY